MNTTLSAEQQHTITLSKDFRAPAEKIFDAWTDPEVLKSWFGPEGVVTTAASIDLRPGGSYSLTMALPDGKTVIHRGVYRSIEKPSMLSFTWILEGQDCEGSKEQHAETLVTLEFQEKNNITTLVLTHDFLPSESSKEAHGYGWAGSLDRLMRVFSSEAE